MRQLDQQPRVLVAQKRTALSKLLKDFDRVRTTLNAITNECNSIRVSVISVDDSSGSSKLKEKDDEEGDSNEGMHNQQYQLVQTLQGKDVDEAILRERERDLRKINQDLAMVNEMFK